MRATLDGLLLRRLITIGSPIRLTDIVSHFSENLQLPEHIELQQRRLMEEKFGEQVWERYALDRAVKDMPIPGLLVHDRDDTHVSMENALALSENWPNSSLLITEKLGHSRILKDPQTVAKIVDYVISNE